MESIGRYELWMVAQLTFGAVFVGGATFLLPPFVLSLDGASPGDVGVVMAVLPLIGLAAPVVGGLLDRFGSFRAFQHLGLGALAVGFGVLAISADLVGAAAGALILGVGAALVVTTNLSMMAGAGLSEEEVASRIALLQMSVPAGQVIGLLTVAVLLAIDVGFSGVFLVLAVLAVVGALATATANAPAAARARRQRRLAVATAERTAEVQPETISLGAVLMSSFGLLLVALFIAFVAHGALESQYPNFMNDVFGIDGDFAAVALAVATLVSVPLYPAVGRWIQSAPAKLPLLVAITIRGVVGVSLFILAAEADIPALLPLVLYGIAHIAFPLIELPGSMLAAGASPLGPGGGQGGYGFALAAAQIVGALLAGWAAAEFGYRSLALIMAIGGGIALVVAFGLPGEDANRHADVVNG